MRETQLYVDGHWTGGDNRFEIISPVTGTVIGMVAEGTRADVQQALDAANAAWPDWSRRSAFERSRLLEAVAQRIIERRDELANTLTLEQGKPLYSEAYQEVDELVEYFRLAAGDGLRLEGFCPPSMDARKRVIVQRVPRGVIGIITPWNWPYTMPAELIAPALAAGNAVVWAPAPSTSLCAVLLTECIVEAGLPAGLLNLVTGYGAVVGDEIAVNKVTHAIGFIGSIETGHKVAARAAGKELLLEMGGNGPLIVLDDADLDRAADAIIKGAFLCAGQSCSAAELILVQETVHQALLERLADIIPTQIRLGDPFARETTMGPLNNEGVASKMDQHVRDALAKGASLVSGGARANNFPTPLYYQPTLLDQVTGQMQVATHETFGPVVPVQVIRDVDEALTIVNTSTYGLTTAIFTQDLKKAMQFADVVRSGTVVINDTTNWYEPHIAFGGAAGSRSGIGRVGGRTVFEKFTDYKTVFIDLA
ncbi:MAG: aldehyde dehydrogenase [Burkholderiales bacterium]|nr:aldehyde dehydrogenase [Anaerolineae bacterium]